MPGADEARPEPGRARHRARPRRATGRGVLVVLAVLAVVLGAGGIASLVGEDAPAGTAVDSRTPAPVGSGPASSRAPVAPPSEAGRAAGTSTAPAPTAATPGATGSEEPGDAGTTAAGAVPGPATAATASTDAPAPVSLQVPAIDVDLTSLVPLGLADDGTIEVPEDPDDAGWLTAGPPPGTTGPAVIAGHVDSRDGPAVFSRLSELAEGDQVTVGLADGSTVTYVVTGSETYPKDEFPTERVYGPAPAPVLRLITCGGDFDRAESSYVDNVVVYAVLAG
ncbi:class F sortase [Jannaschia sp. R86511]|uniref:class F sortase n=1 Tax=Jannaschia sp. R86511 TaxID=3093853 RepID=UPI0036D2DA41